MCRCLPIAQKWMRRFLLQQCLLLQIAPSLVNWETIVPFTQQNCKQFCLLLNKLISHKKGNSLFSQTLQALGNLKTDHPLLIQELLHKINAHKKETVLGHIGIRGNKAADRAAKEALNTEPTADHIPFSDLKPLTAKYVYEVWQKEWNETGLVSDKFHVNLLKLSDKLIFL